MLDRKTKDHDASIELLEDKKKQADMLFTVFYFGGGLLTTIPILLQLTVSGILLGLSFIGMFFLMVAGYVMIIHLRYSIYLFFIRKGVVDAKDVKE